MRSKSWLLAMAVGGTLGLSMSAANAQDAAAAPAADAGAAAAPAAPAADAGGGAAPAPAPAADSGAAAAPAPAADAGSSGGSAPAPAADASPAPAADASAAAAPSDSGGGGGGGGEESGGFLKDLFGGIHMGGFIRPEFSIATTNVRNENNTRGDPYNNQIWYRPAFAPDLSYSPTLAALNLAPLQNGGLGGSSWTLPFTVGGIGAANYGRRLAPNSTNLFHMHYLRFEVETNWKFTNDLSFTARLRVITDPGHYSSGSTQGTYFGGSADESFTPRGVGGDPALYGGGANLFAYHAEKRHYIASPANFTATGGRPLLAYYSVDNHPMPLEWSDSHYLVYFPTFFLDYQHGPISIRMGNQQIAWGQALFFRVLDTPNGLDTRRHLILDQAAEEFGDKRTPSPSIRVGYQFTDDILADGFVKMFTPTILPNPETPYNIIPDQFTIHDLYEEKKWRMDYGIRLKGNFGNFGLQFIAIRHMDPGGAFRWSQSAVVKGLPNSDQVAPPGLSQPIPAAGGEAAIFETVESTIAGTHGAASGFPLPCSTTTAQNAGQCQFGEVFSQTPFEAASSGVYSSNEWFHYAGDVRLNGVTGLNGAIVPFPAAGAALAGPVSGSGGLVANQTLYMNGYSSQNALGADCKTGDGGTAGQNPACTATALLPAGYYNAATRARNELDTFFGASGGGLRGHLVREYFRETIIGGGVSYVTQGTPGSVLDQLIINVETSYTPKHTFTDPSLYKTLADPYLRQANWISDVVMEKYQRFTQAFPATYFVFQYEHRMKDDIFGRSLRGYAGSGGHNNSVPRRSPGGPGTNGDTMYISNSVLNQGVSGGSNYVVFAFLQPFPQAIYRFDFAMLCDIRGGCLVQPGVRWKPSGAITIEGFYTYINGRLGGNDNNNAISTLQFAQEFTMRLGFQF